MPSHWRGRSERGGTTGSVWKAVAVLDVGSRIASGSGTRRRCIGSGRTLARSYGTTAHSAQAGYGSSTRRCGVQYRPARRVGARWRWTAWLRPHRRAACARGARDPATDSVSEWGDEILALDQLLVEGFLQTPLRKLATDAGRPVDKKWQSLRLLQDHLEANGSATDEAKAVIAPLYRLHKLRSLLKGYGAPTERTAQTKKARTEHGNFRAHFKALAGECDASFITLLKALGAVIKID